MEFHSIFQFTSLHHNSDKGNSSEVFPIAAVSGWFWLLLSWCSLVPVWPRLASCQLVTSPGSPVQATPTNKLAIYNKHKGLENKYLYFIFCTMLPIHRFGELEWSWRMYFFNECISGGRDIVGINNLSPLSIDVWLCYAFIRILAQVSKYRQRSPVIRFRVWPINQLNISADHLLRSPLNFTLLLIFLLVPSLRCLPVSHESFKSLGAGAI